MVILDCEISKMSQAIQYLSWMSCFHCYILFPCWNKANKCLLKLMGPFFILMTIPPVGPLTRVVWEDVEATKHNHVPPISCSSFWVAHCMLKGKAALGRHITPIGYSSSLTFVQLPFSLTTCSLLSSIFTAFILSPTTFLFFYFFPQLLSNRYICIIRHKYIMYVVFVPPIKVRRF